ncbi:MAG: PrsW family intramembrane metalloprotease [Thermoplasmata archaeon]|nr:PrsW family intramembrane metalloprotease [Thermoplasmata archaeon]
MKSLPNLNHKYIAIALGFGALSTLLATWGEMGLMSDTLPILMPFTPRDSTPITILMAVLIAPFVEELAKPLGLYLINAEEKPNFTLKEWAFLGAMTGLGFAIVENILYGSTVADSGMETAGWLIFLRFLLPLHMIASAISGFGFGLWVKTKNAKYFIICLLIAMVLHGLFNLAATVIG